MIMYKLLIAGCMQLVAITYVTSDIAKSSYMPLSFRSMDSTDYNGGVEYQIFDDRFPRSDEELFNLTDQLSATYDYALPMGQTIPIRITGDAVDIPLAKFADGLDKDFNFENSSQPESTDEIRNFVKINTPPMIDPQTLLTEILKQTSSKMSVNTTTSKTTTGTPATTKSKITTISKRTITNTTTNRTTTTTPTKTTNITITTTPTKSKNRTITTTSTKTTNSTTTTSPTKNRITTTIPTTNTKTDMVEKEVQQNESSEIKLTPKKGLEGSGRSFHKEDDVISSNILHNGFETDSSYLQRDNFARYQKKLDDLSPEDDDELQKVDEPTQIEDNEDEDRIYEGWLSDGTPVQCKKSVVPFLNCKLEMFHVGELPFFYYGLTLLNSNLADKVCPCPMPRLEPDCVNTAHRVARYMEHICHAYLRISLEDTRIEVGKTQPFYRLPPLHGRTILDLLFWETKPSEDNESDMFK